MQTQTINIRRRKSLSVRIVSIMRERGIDEIDAVELIQSLYDDVEEHASYAARIGNIKRCVKENNLVLGYYVQKPCTIVYLKTGHIK